MTWAKLKEDHIADGDYIRAPLQDITTPKEGRVCLLNRFWLVTGDGEVLFYRTYEAPQCHANEEAVKQLNAQLLAGPANWRVEKIPVAYVPR
jgi:hypothetical protein